MTYYYELNFTGSVLQQNKRSEPNDNRGETGGGREILQGAQAVGPTHKLVATLQSIRFKVRINMKHHFPHYS